MTGDPEPDHPFRTFVIASLPGWGVGVVVAIALHRLVDLPLWAAVLLAAIWIATDLASFPRLRRYYMSEPAELRMVGKRGVAVSRVGSHGFVRVHGELWRARSADPDVTIDEGAAVCVVGIDGLELTVVREK